MWVLTNVFWGTKVSNHRKQNIAGNLTKQQENTGMNVSIAGAKNYGDQSAYKYLFK